MSRSAPGAALGVPAADRAGGVPGDDGVGRDVARDHRPRGDVRALADGDASLTDVGNDFRLDPTAMTVFAIGLLLVAIAAVLAAIAVWRSGSLPRWSAVPLAALLVTMLPQYFLPQALRIVWGVLVAGAALWLASALWRAVRS